MKYKNHLLVTGGAGFIGSAFLRNLVPKYPDWFFVNLDLLTYAGDLKKVESIANSSNYLFIHGDICDRKLVEEIFQEHEINWVVNFAAESHVDNSIKDSTAFIQTNIAGTHVLLDVAKENWVNTELIKDQEHYLFMQISTDEVYGSLEVIDTPCSEDAKISPRSPYSASKASAELLARAYFETYELPIIITRSSNNYGPFQNLEKLIPKVINNALNDELIPLYGNGSNIRDWIYVDDNVNALEKILHYGFKGEVYNISSGKELTNVEVVEIILNIIPESKSRVVFVKDRLGHDFRYSISNNKINELGWRKIVDFQDGLLMTINYYEKKK
jgi:dTDP-glucose 4,6-dehydratase